MEREREINAQMKSIFSMSSKHSKQNDRGNSDVSEAPQRMLLSYFDRWGSDF